MMFSRAWTFWQTVQPPKQYILQKHDGYSWSYNIIILYTVHLTAKLETTLQVIGTNHNKQYYEDLPVFLLENG